MLSILENGMWISATKMQLWWDRTGIGMGWRWEGDGIGHEWQCMSCTEKTLQSGGIVTDFALQRLPMILI